MEFEFDSAKSAMNKQKHGIDFLEAQALWNDPNALGLPARIDAEHRMAVVGKIGEQHWTAVITYRGDNIRIISVRRARREEIVIYEEA